MFRLANLLDLIKSCSHVICVDSCHSLWTWQLRTQKYRSVIPSSARDTVNMATHFSDFHVTLINRFDPQLQACRMIWTLSSSWAAQQKGLVTLRTHGSVADVVNGYCFYMYDVCVCLPSKYVDIRRFVKSTEARWNPVRILFFFDVIHPTTCQISQKSINKKKYISFHCCCIVQETNRAYSRNDDTIANKPHAYHLHPHISISASHPTPSASLFSAMRNVCCLINIANVQWSHTKYTVAPMKSCGRRLLTSADPEHTR